MKKPRIKVAFVSIYGPTVWKCSSEISYGGCYGPIFHTAMGLGYSPEHAYREWMMDTGVMFSQVSMKPL